MSVSSGDIGNLYTFGASIHPQNYVADRNGDSLDCQDLSEEITVIVQHGVLEGDTSIIVELEESSDDTTFTDISGAATATTTTDSGITYATFSGRAQRYVRAVANFSGSSIDAFLAVSIGAKKKSF